MWTQASRAECRAALKKRKAERFKAVNLVKIFQPRRPIFNKEDKQMIILSNRARNCLKKFVEWGGFAGVVFYLIEGKIFSALLSALIFGIIVVFVEILFNEIP
jgi:hypothetical protein